MIHRDVTRRSSRNQNRDPNNLLLRAETEKYIAHYHRIRSRHCDTIVSSTERFPEDLTVKPVGEAVNGAVDLLGVFGRDGCEDGEEDGDAQGGDEGGYHAGAGDVRVGCYPFLRRAVEGGAGTTHRSTIHDDSLSERCEDSIQEES